jgi:hypothetical protein
MLHDCDCRGISVDGILSCQTMVVAVMDLPTSGNGGKLAKKRNGKQNNSSNKVISVGVPSECFVAFRS